ncbi:ABC transporter ATP-binding protein [Paenibacillus eucommiae]|uniref:Teichoic acid transport system ATP-binding protein n=1 Tax=Paenibacillus eucommiae TaxID=1355755 RepID=A0ABS4IVP3_9BACL|nr:ABC transporter ATP-binding protein [Paenibacillus eucommiae]MBP1991150.1 teichoic acid transport system ATP-binding protein [Paenibacillus eucommiae]
MTSDIAIHLDHISKVYKLYDKPADRLKESLHLLGKKFHKEFHAVRDISFQVNKGETLGILGKNGSGKSTLLKMITGVLTPSAGKITVNGKISALLELGAGFNVDYTGLENIYLNGTIMGYSKEEMNQKLDDILSFADIGDFIHQPVKIYSSGMFARLAFAVAINVDPDILIVDEALAVGDVAFQAKCYKKFNEFREEGKTILFVSHSLDTIIQYCTRAILINKGNFIADGSPKQIVDEYKKLLVKMDGTIKPTTTGNTIHAQNALWKSSYKLNIDPTLYGDRRAEIIDFGIFDAKDCITENVLSDELISIKMRVKFNIPISNPIFAFTIKDLKGLELAGTNTLYEQYEPAEYGVNQEIIISFTQRIPFHNGNYTLSLGCTGYEQDEFVVYHRLYDIIIFQCLNSKQSVGYYDLSSNVLIESEKGE